jgi:hypothetical protein
MMRTMPPERDGPGAVRGQHYRRNTPGFQAASYDWPAVGMLSGGPVLGWAAAAAAGKIPADFSGIRSFHCL